ncbi:MAG: dethiobiotin synthase [Sphingomonadales bacterium]
MTPLFITGTGTGVGKTLVTAALTHQVRARGMTVRALKPVLSGFDIADETDAHVLLAAQDLGTSQLDTITPWRFAAPLSPDMAAAREGRTVPFEDLVIFCHDAMAEGHDYVLIEGVGGAFVPLDAGHTVADWIAALDIPAVVVTGSYLGTLSHTIATVRAMEAHGLSVAAVVVSESPDAPASLDETMATLTRFLPGTRLLALPGISAGATPAWQRAADLSALI